MIQGIVVKAEAWLILREEFSLSKNGNTIMIEANTRFTVSRR